MSNTSPFVAMQQMDMQLRPLLRAIDVESLDVGPRKAVIGIRRLIVDAKLDIRDYELSETRVEQLKNAHLAKKRIEKFRQSILEAGNVFSAADVAQFTAELEQISGWLQ